MPSLRTMFKAWQGWRAQLLHRGAERPAARATTCSSLDCTAPFNPGGRRRRRRGRLPPTRRRCCGSALPSARSRSTRRPSATLRENDPRFAEAHLFLGELALGHGTLRTAEKHLRRGRSRRSPTSPAARLTLGHVYLAMEDLDFARDAYHRVNAAVPGQREAMLGEAKSLSYLGRHEEAIAILDEMERLGTWYMGEMYYWRAWNRHRLRQYDAANDDVLAARSRMPMDPQVDKLAGLHRPRPERGAARRARVPPGGRSTSKGKGERDCDAGYYLGQHAGHAAQVGGGRADLRERRALLRARREGRARSASTTIRTSDLPDERQDAPRRGQGAGHRLRVGCSRRVRASTPPSHYANLGDVAKARPFAERAAAHPEMKEPRRAAARAPRPLVIRPLRDRIDINGVNWLTPPSKGPLT